jgi:[histone H3]-lysine36 N-dimethyltransferase SETMAR
MCDLKEQRTCLKFCFLLGKTPTESLEMLQEAFKEQALSRARVFEWFSRFKKGDLSIEDQPRSGRPSSNRNNENIAKIHEKLDEDHRCTIDELSEITGVSWSSVQRILTQDLGMRRVAAKFVPRLLTEDQRKSRLTVCQDLKRELENDPNFLSRVITGDESWCYGYDPESKQASSQWKTPRSPRPKKNQTGEIECQNNADLFLRHSRNCAQGIHSQGSDGQPGVLPGGFEPNEGEGAEDKAGIVAIGRMAHSP